MHIVWAIIAGLIIGLLAKLFLRGRQSTPLWVTIGVGIIGGLVGNWLASGLHVRHTNGVDWIRHALQVGVAMVLIALVTPFFGRRRRSALRF